MRTLRRHAARRCAHCGAEPLWIALLCGFGWQCTARCPTGKAWRAAVAAEERAIAAQRGAP